MKVEANKVVAITYDLHVSTAEEGERHVESASTESPMMILMGLSGLPEKFEENIVGLEANGDFDFILSAQEGYGEHSMEAVMDLPREVFQNDAGEFDEKEVFVGAFLQLMDQEGHYHRGLVKAVNENVVVMDFNHPLSGLDMHFKGTVLSVREATAEEMEHGHVHGEGGHHH